MLAVGHHRAEDAVGPPPHELPRHGVQGVGSATAHLGVPRGVAAAARTGGEVDEAADDARRSVDRRRRLEAPQSVAGRRVERHEVPVVGAHVDPPTPHRGGGVDVRAGALRPENPPAGRAEGVERPVGVPDVHPAVGDRGRGVEVLPDAEPREGLRPPSEAPRARVERIHAPAVGPEEDLPVGERRRAVDLVVRGEGPPRLTRVDVHRVELVVPRARVERPADHERRAFEDAGAVAPDDLPRPGRHRDDHPRLAAGLAVARDALHPGVVDDAVGDRGR
jgi:hypothetical protein